LKSVKYDYQKGQIDQFTEIWSSIQDRVDSKSKNSDPTPRSDINNHKIEINTEENRKNMIEKSKYVFKYVFREHDVIIYPPYKNFVLEISIRGI